MLGLIGPIINTVAVMIGSILGIFLSKFLSSGFEKTMMTGLGLTTIVIGINMGLKTSNMVIVLLSIVIGAIIGEIINVEKRFENIGDFLKKKFQSKSKSKNEKFTEGFVASTFIICIGSMAIVGSLESGLSHNYNTLIAKSIIDFFTVMFLASAMGFGVFFSSFSILVYQGLIAALAIYIEPYLTTEIINEISATGGMLILAAGINISGMTTLKVGNLIPAMFVAIPITYLIPFIPFL